MSQLFHGDNPSGSAPGGEPVDTPASERRSESTAGAGLENDDEVIEEFDLDDIELIESKVFG